MAERIDNDGFADLPAAAAQPKARWRFQVVWLIPIVSALIGGWLAVKAVLDKGPTIEITFKSADGLEAGKTKLKYKDVEIGLVKTVTLAPDLSHVVASAEVAKAFTPHLVEDTRFWVVRPRISGGTVTGLGTLLSGSYIGVDTGKSNATKRAYQGLEVPPLVTIDTPGREFTLKSDVMASVDTGSPVFFRRLKVGQVTSYGLNDDGKGVTLKVFVQEPYDKYVGANTRFWNASGFDLTLDSGGVKFEMESLLSLVLGGISFESPPDAASFVRANANAEFMLFENRAEAMKNPETEVLKFLLVFNESARGLSPGAQVDFRGLIVGEVASVKIDVDEKRGIIVPVEVNIYPARMRAAARTTMDQKDAAGRQQFMDQLVARGMRAQLRSASLVTGKLYVALDFFPRAPKAQMRWASAPAEVPTTPSGLAELQQTIASLATKLDKFPLAELGTDARTAIGSADKLLKRVDTDITPELKVALKNGAALMARLDSEVTGEAKAMLVDARKAFVTADKLLAAESPLQSDTREAMRELARAAHSIRMLADYLERNPQSVIMGKKEGGE